MNEEAFNSEYDLSVVVSSYNRDDKIVETLDRLFESNLDGFRKVEIIVVDDGSPRPISDLLPQLKYDPDMMTVRLEKQQNAGAGAARNTGFKASRADIVVFLDDDILVEADTLQALVKAHDENPAGIIFGLCPFVSHSSDSVRRFAQHLTGYYDRSDGPKYEQVEEMASGVLSVSKRLLVGVDFVYRSDLSIPAAEEYEAIWRLKRSQVSVNRARHISVLHNHHLELEWLAEQQFKYGMGTAEAFLKYPDITELNRFANLRSNMDLNKGGPLRNFLKKVLATGKARRFLLSAANVCERVSPKGNHLFLFGMLTTAYFRAGYEQGIRKFSSSLIDSYTPTT